MNIVLIYPYNGTLYSLKINADTMKYRITMRMSKIQLYAVVYEYQNNVEEM